MIVVGIAGWSGSGKTTLIGDLIPLLTAAGASVSTIKHAHDGFDLDRPGKDSWRHREAGAQEVMLASNTRWALLHEQRGAEPEPAILLARLAPVDLVLVEGFKRHPFPKLEVYRPALGKEPLWPDNPTVRAVASDTGLPDCPLPVLDLNDPAMIRDWLLRALQTWPALPQAPGLHGGNARIGA
jgi:molybdopterin-guanine dinucleotide biosynthesis protein B